jgi:hypothetical protein
VQVPRWVVVTLAVVAAVPFGWLLGVAVAELIVGRELGVFPVLTIPLGLAAAIAFALSSKVSPAARLAILLIGTGAFALFL